MVLIPLDTNLVLSRASIYRYTEVTRMLQQLWNQNSETQELPARILSTLRRLYHSHNDNNILIDVS